MMEITLEKSFRYYKYGHFIVKNCAKFRMSYSIHGGCIIVYYRTFSVNAFPLYYPHATNETRRTSAARQKHNIVGRNKYETNHDRNFYSSLVRHGNEIDR